MKEFLLVLFIMCSTTSCCWSEDLDRGQDNAVPKDVIACVESDTGSNETSWQCVVDSDCITENACVVGVCDPTFGCSYSPKLGQQTCEIGGLPGVCEVIFCRNDTFEGGCYDGNPCTHDYTWDLYNGKCDHPEVCYFNTEVCIPDVSDILTGVRCEVVDCDDGDPCTEDYYDYAYIDPEDRHCDHEEILGCK